MMRGLRRYPFEIFAAFLVFCLGVYGLVNPLWPPFDSEPWEIFVMNAEIAYFIVSGGAVMSTFFTRNKWPIESIVIQMFGWLFIGFAGIIALIIRIFIPQSELIDSPSLLGSIFTTIVWFALIGASFTKYVDIRMWYKKEGNKK